MTGGRGDADSVAGLDSGSARISPKGRNTRRLTQKKTVLLTSRCYRRQVEGTTTVLKAALVRLTMKERERASRIIPWTLSTASHPSYPALFRSHFQLRKPHDLIVSLVEYLHFYIFSL
jgi:hypothetical protein